MARRNIIDLAAPYLAPVLAPIVRLKSLSMVAFLFCILAVIIIPLPATILDFFLAMSIAIAVLIILISIYIPKPTDLTTFPTLLLVITLFRLALNIATTRMILTNGYLEASQPGYVSHLIRAFGDFVASGNLVVGIVIFSILVLINFMVVTKGSTRVSEVQARFTLDAMPGKQMAIDADLNAGLIDENTARSRRQEIISEANFYGAMDGSSKFIKGDAIAGIIITIINIIGGILIGIFQYDMSFSDAGHTFTILTIGDGLVSQIPALVVSTAMAIIITRASKDEENFAEGSLKQLLGEYRTLLIVGFILFIFALVPGLPTGSLLFMAMLFLGLGYLSKQVREGKLNVTTPKKPKSATPTAAPTPPKKSEKEIAEEEQTRIDDILKIEMLELELGYGLIRLAETELVERVRSMRRGIAQSLGFLTPKVRIRDNLQLKPNEYNFKIKGNVVASSEIYPDKYLAMDNGYATREIEGIATKDPAFNSDAIWIDANQKDDATLNGYFVIEPASVIITHMSEMIKTHASELLTRQEVQTLLDKAKNDYPVVVEECTKYASTGLIQKVLKSLLKDQIPIKDFISILEAITEIAEVSKSFDLTIEHVRVALARVITNLYADDNGNLSIYTLDNETSAKILNATRFDNATASYQTLLNSNQAGVLIAHIKAKIDSVGNTRIKPFVICVDPQLRKFIANLCSTFNLNAAVISIAEIAENTKYTIEGEIKAEI